MYDPWLEEDPWVQGLQAKSRAEGFAEGRLRTLRDFVMHAVRLRFPNLTVLAQVRLLQPEQPEVLLRLFEHILDALDEDAARVILEKKAV